MYPSLGQCDALSRCQTEEPTACSCGAMGATAKTPSRRGRLCLTWFRSSSEKAQRTVARLRLACEACLLSERVALGIPGVACGRSHGLSSRAKLRRSEQKTATRTSRPFSKVRTGWWLQGGAQARNGCEQGAEGAARLHFKGGPYRDAAYSSLRSRCSFSMTWS